MKYLRKIILTFLFLFFLKTYEVNSEDYKKVLVELPYGQTTLLSTFFVFNEIDTGDFVSRNFFGVDNFRDILGSSVFERLMPVPPGSEISAWNYAVMGWQYEFWIFRNNDDGYLWGTGCYLE